MNVIKKRLAITIGTPGDQIVNLVVIIEIEVKSSYLVVVDHENR